MSEAFAGGGDFSGGDSGGAPIDTGAPVEAGGVSQDTAPNDGINPAWSPALEGIPPEFHNKLTPHFKEWDSNYQRGLEKARNEVQSQYANYQPLIDAGVQPNQIGDALTLMKAINEDPQRVYSALASQMGISDPSGQGSVSEYDEESYDPTDTRNDPHYKELEEKFNALSEGLMQKEQEQKEQQLYQETLSDIETTIEGLGEPFKAKYGFDMDGEQVMRIALQNIEMGTTKELDIQAAADQWGDMINKYRTPQPTAGQMTPNILPTSGGIPQSNMDIAKLTEDQRQNMVATMLKNSFG